MKWPSGDLRGEITQQPKRQFTSGFVRVKARETSFVINKKFEVSEFCRAFEFLDRGDGAVYQPWTVTLLPLFSATTMIIDTNGTAYERL